MNALCEPNDSRLKAKTAAIYLLHRYLDLSGAVKRSRKRTVLGFNRRDVTGLWEMESLLEPTPNPAWVLTAEGFDALREAIYELRFSISNGFLGLRAGRAVSCGERWVLAPSLRRWSV